MPKPKLETIPLPRNGLHGDESVQGYRYGSLMVNEQTESDCERYGYGWVVAHIRTGGVIRPRPLTLKQARAYCEALLERDTWDWKTLDEYRAKLQRYRKQIVSACKEVGIKPPKELL